MLVLHVVIRWPWKKNRLFPIALSHILLVVTELCYACSSLCDRTRNLGCLLPPFGTSNSKVRKQLVTRIQ